MKGISSFILGLTLALFFSNADAKVRVRPRSLKDYAKLGEKLYRSDSVWVEGCTLSYVNYEAIRRDFKSLEKFSDKEIYDLLIENFSYISKSQLKLNGIRNSEIPANVNKVKDSYRSGGSGRSDIMELKDAAGNVLGMVDRKGAGVLEHDVERNLKSVSQIGLERTKDRDHSDGLATHGESLTETARQQARQLLYEVSHLDAQTVETYFVLVFPFKILKSNGKFDTASIYAREANIGRDYSYKSPLPKGEEGASQQDNFGDGVDQGMVRISDKRLESTFGAFGPDKRNPQETSDWKWSHETANAYDLNPDPNIVSNHFRQMLEPIQNQIVDKVPSEDRGDFNSEFINFCEIYGKSTDFKWKSLVALVLGRLQDSELLNSPVIKTVSRDLISDPEGKFLLSFVRGLKFMAEDVRKLALEKMVKGSGEVRYKLVNSYLEESDMVWIYKALANDNNPAVKASIQERLATAIKYPRSNPEIYAYANSVVNKEKIEVPAFNGCPIELGHLHRLHQVQGL